MAHLPVSRIRTIMKTTDGADQISKDAIFVTARAAEIFIKELALMGYKDTNNGKRLNYENLVNVVHSNNQYEFLEHMIPRKITVREFKELIKKKNNGKGSNDGEEVSDSESSSESGTSNESTESSDSDDGDVEETPTETKEKS